LPIGLTMKSSGRGLEGMMNGTHALRNRFALLMAAGIMTATTAHISGQVIVPRNWYYLNPDDFVEITAGNHHTCARKQNGAVYCWGRNDLGQLGIGYTGGPVNTMQFVTYAAQIDAGTDHTCVIDFASRAWCWGYNGTAGTFGALGANANMQLQGAPGADIWPLPIAVDGNLVVNAISAGQSSTCATTTTGLFCWGAIATPATGSGGQSTPMLVDSWTGYQRPAVGRKHACTVAVWGTWRQAACFGDNSAGQLAQDPNASFFTFAAPSFLGFPMSSLFANPTTRLATQVDFTCAEGIGGLQCAGRNTWGQLGNGNRTDTFQPQTVPPVNGQPLRGVSTGVNHACALDANGAAFCWGYDEFGQTGNNTYGPFTHFTSPQAVTGGFTFRAVATGRDHTCGIATTNVIYCWGSNSYGQLGAGRSATQRVGALRFLVEPSPWDPVR
jgi:alpha-tubulin suppressor-like RCC1 family protein